MSRPVEASPDAPGALYENSDIFLRHLKADPFDADFEQSLRDVPSLPVRNSGSSLSSSSGGGNALSPPSLCGSARSSKKSSYDEMSINAGRPVIIGDVEEGQDSLTAVTFGSPFQDSELISSKFPVPAPRPSKQQQQQVDEEPSEEEADAGIYEELHPKRIEEEDLPGVGTQARPDVPPRNKTLDLDSVPEVEAKVDNLYCELDCRTENVIRDSRNRNFLDDNENEEETDKFSDDNLAALTESGRRLLLNPRSTTIDIRNDVNKLWERAVQELDLDESLVEYMEKKHELDDSKKSEEKKKRGGKVKGNSYDSVAVPEQRFKIVNGVQVPIPITLLKNFDPYYDDFKEEDEDKESSSSSRSSSRRSSSSSESSSLAKAVGQTRDASECSMSDSLKQSTPSCTSADRKENTYETRRSRANDSTTSSSSVDLPPPSIPPPPAPRSYENVWLSDAGLPQIYAKATPPSKPRRSFRKPLNSSFSEDGACALPPRSSTERNSTSDDGVSLASSQSLEKEAQMCSPAASSTNSPPLHMRNNSVQRSSSTSNLSFITKKFSFAKIGRKFSDQAKKPSQFAAKEGFAEENSSVDSAMDDQSSSYSPRRSIVSLESTCPGTVNHSGPLYLCSKGKKVQAHEKWCVLGNANLRYFNRKDSLAEPKELILLKDVLSLSKRKEASSVGSEECDILHCFDVTFAPSQDRGSRGKWSVRTFGTLTENVRDGWVEKIAQSLSYRISSFSLVESTKLGWVYLKQMFAGEWNHSWISLQGRTILYTLNGEDLAERVDLKKVKNTTLVRDVKNLNAPLSAPVLVVDFIDRSLYIQSFHEKESLHWKEVLEEVAFNNGGALGEQQMTKDDIPVVVEQCVNFVFRHGCMSEGIYRRSGVKTKIDRLLTEFRKNAWAVTMTIEEFNEHDVANTLKRFMRTLDEPLLTKKLRASWMAASKLHDDSEKKDRYSQLLSSLPDINARTLRRIMGHLRTIANQCDKTLMPNYNLAAIWGPTLLTVDNMEATDFAQTTGEADVCRDLIDNYKYLFKVTTEEIEREEEIVKKTESFNRNPNPVKISGEVMMFVHIDTKSGGDCVSLAVTPKMTALELQKRVLLQANYSGDSSKFVLHEVVLGGELERPIHYNEVIYEVILKWWQWSDEDRRDTYLLLKRNAFWEEAVPCSLPPLSVFGETMFGDNVRGSKGLFKKYHLSVNNAKITRSKEQKNGIALELDSWDIERIIWYFGCEAKRSSPYNLNITFIEKEVPVERGKERPFFGRTISFASRELFIKWVAAMMVAEHQSDIIPPETLLNIDDD